MKYSPDGQSVLTDDGRTFACDEWHRMDNTKLMLNAIYGGNGADERPTHWLIHRRLPEVPKVKTQEELDDEAFLVYHTIFPPSCKTKCHNTWHHACAYARAQQEAKP